MKSKHPRRKVRRIQEESDPSDTELDSFMETVVQSARNRDHQPNKNNELLVQRTLEDEFLSASYPSPQCEVNPLVRETDDSNTVRSGENRDDAEISDDEQHPIPLHSLHENTVEGRASELNESSLLIDDIESLENVQSRQRNLLINQNRRVSRRNIDHEVSGLAEAGDIALPSSHARELWKQEITRVLRQDKTFFKNSEALMQNSSKVTRGSISYHGIRISPDNCIDIHTVYEDGYIVQDVFQERTAAQRLNSGRKQYTQSFRQLTSVIGQFMRWAIVRKEIPLFDGWKENALFRALSKALLVQTFVEYFRIRGTASTVNCKTIHLRTAIRSAINKCGDDIAKQEDLKMVYFYLQKCGNACKRIGRGKSTLQRVSFARAAEGKLLMVDDFSTCITKARKSLNGIINSYELSLSSANSCRPLRLIFSDGLLKKWCINFLALTMFLSGGQRPQVFQQMQCPNDEDMQLWSSSSHSSRYIELETITEKRARVTEMPNVVVPKSILPFLQFHVRTVRPIILQHSRIDEPTTDRPLLIHSGTGKYLETEQIRTSLRSFAERVDPDLKNITPMSLRASYATLMFRAHRAGEIFSNLDEDSFLRELGKMMNTSIEQLKQTYISCDSHDFHETANEVAAFLSGIGNNDIAEFTEIEADIESYRREKDLRKLLY